MRFGRDASIAWDNPELPNTANMVQIIGSVEPKLKDPRVQQLDKDFKAFWDLEHLGILPNEAGETEFLESYFKSITRQNDGRYVVKYPFRSEKTDFDDCYAIAEKRLLGLLASPKFTFEQRSQYHALFQEYLELGFIKQANPKYTGRQAYLPHRPVIREDAQTTKIRPVFDGSVHFKHKRSFNANLEVGPNLNPEIMGILMRWRRHKIVWTADIEKAFLQIAIHPDHEQIVRFLWVKNPQAKRPEIVQYVWTRLSFGLTSSPFILRVVLLKHLREFDPLYPGIAQATLDQLYVDDWMGGSETTEEALKQTQLVNELLRGTKMSLGKWVTNSADLIHLAKKNINFSMATSMLARGKVFDHKPNKALGIIWDPVSDKFTFNADRLKSDAETYGEAITKRQLFSLGLKIYDPIGLIAPVTLKAKIAMQLIWLDTTKWDQSIKAERLPLWKKYLESLTGLEHIKVSRHVKIDPSQPSEIHIFCDASEQAYGAVAYEVQNGQISLIAAKTRVAPAPKRALSILRLELLSNLIATELGKYILTQHRTKYKVTV